MKRDLRRPLAFPMCDPHYCEALLDGIRNKGKLFPVTYRSDPHLHAMPDEGEQGYTAFFPIKGQLLMITHQGSTQLVSTSVYIEVLQSTLKYFEVL